jgi:hypothetical protein
MSMNKVRSLAGAALFLLAGPLVASAQDATPVASPAASGAAVIGTYVLPDTPLSQYQNAQLPNGQIANDRKFLLGGIGSDLFHQPGAPDDEFWMVTDRGPNADFEAPDGTRLTFPVPDFTPTILHVKIADGAIQVLEALPIVGQSGAPVTGLGNIDGMDDVPYSFDGQTALPFNVNGLDTEGLVRTSTGDFWLAEEYSTSILHVGADGKVIARYTPEGITLDGADYEVIDNLPAIYADRRSNRGFEGLALNGDETTVYAALQSPLYLPDSKAGKASLNTRILAFDIATAAPSAEYVYEFDDVNAFDPSAEGDPSLMKLSAISWVDGERFIIDERTDPVAKLYVVDLGSATDILGTPWDDAATSPSLEQTTDYAAAGITPLAKTLLVDLNTIGEFPVKIEGVAVINDTTIAVANDNDFDVNEFDADGNLIGTGKQSEIFVISVPAI